jgi:hypothetical protein
MKLPRFILTGCSSLHEPVPRKRVHRARSVSDLRCACYERPTSDPSGAPSAHTAPAMHANVAEIFSMCVALATVTASPTGFSYLVQRRIRRRHPVGRIRRVCPRCINHLASVEPSSPGRATSAGVGRELARSLCPPPSPIPKPYPPNVRGACQIRLRRTGLMGVPRGTRALAIPASLPRLGGITPSRASAH